MFCSFCLAFGKEDNRFTVGCSALSSTNPYTRIKEHEKSVSHENSSEAFLLFINSNDIRSRLDTVRRFENERRRSVLQRLIDTIKLIGKRGLSYRGAKNAEAAYTLNDLSLDHGNFLEIILLLAKYDPLLKEHVDKAVMQSQKLYESRKEAVHAGRPGKFVTFLSKTTADYVIDAISVLLKKNLSEIIKKSEFFSVQIDSTQDINVHDQLAIVVRFVTDDVQERLIALVNCKCGTGKNLCDLLCKVLVDMNLDVTKCVGSSTDGASNMRGQYNGFSAWLNKVSPDQIHVWCYAHVLNLVMIDTSNVTCESTSLFGLLNSIAVFVRESYLRMNKWEENSKFKFISNIGDTRWWSKDRCLTKVFGLYSFPKEALFVDIIQTLNDIYLSDKFNQEIRFKAQMYRDSLLKYETVLTANIYLQIFSSTTPVSLYLQSKGMNVIQAFNMIKCTLNTLNSQSRKFDTILEVTNKFITWANSKLEDLDLEVAITFPVKRILKKKKMFGENANDQPQTNPKLKYEINVYNVIYDQIISSLEKRFNTHGKLYEDISYLNPQYFINTNLPTTAFEFLSKKIQKFKPEITAGSIQTELKDFILKWPRLKKIASGSNLMEELSDEENEILTESDENTICTEKGKGNACQNCIRCVYAVLHKYNLHSSAYSHLYIVYKFVLTLSCTQVRCETTFSKLKYILNRLRNCLSQPKLETFLLMSVEKDLLQTINNEDVIDLISNKSHDLMKLLKL